MANDQYNFSTSSSSNEDEEPDPENEINRGRRKSRRSHFGEQIGRRGAEFHLEHIPVLLTPAAILSRDQVGRSSIEQDEAGFDQLFQPVGGTGSGRLRVNEKPMGVLRKRGGKVRKEQPFLSDQQYKEIRDAFELFDENDSGSLDPQELKVAFRAMGFEIRRDEQRAIMFEKDNGFGAINFNDFAAVAHKKMETRDRAENIHKAFKLIDDDDTGKISFNNLKRVTQQLGENVSDKELQDLLDTLDFDGDGNLDENEFQHIMDKMGAFM